MWCTLSESVDWYTKLAVSEANIAICLRIWGTAWSLNTPRMWKLFLGNVLSLLRLVWISATFGLGIILPPLPMPPWGDTQSSVSYHVFTPAGGSTNYFRPCVSAGDYSFCSFWMALYPSLGSLLTHVHGPTLTEGLRVVCVALSSLALCCWAVVNGPPRHPCLSSQLREQLGSSRILPPCTVVWNPSS